ncbi:MAG: alpha/beta fold hydrolase [Acidiphilium sp.]
MTTRILASGHIRAHRTGAGQPILLLHSLLADASSWSALAGLLESRAEIIVFDLPGFAGLPPIEGGLRPIAQALSIAIDELSLARAPMVIGNGFGSFLALQLALDHPDRVGALTLIGAGLRFSDSGRAAFRAMREEAAAHGLAAIADTAMARLFGADFRADHPELIAERRAAFLRTNPTQFGAACAALEALDFAPDIDCLTASTRILVGAEDQATPPAMAQALAAAIQGATLDILAGLAHVPQLQDPAAIAQLIAA